MDADKKLSNRSNSITFHNVIEVLDRPVKASGNSARVNVPKKYMNKMVKVVILDED